MNNPKNSTFIPAGIYAGQTVYLEPLGNNVRNWHGIREARVKAVKRKYIYVEPTFGREIRIEIESGETPKDDSYCKAGWRLWLAKADYEEFSRAKKKLHDVAAFFGCWTDHKRISMQDVDAIYSVLEKYMEADAEC